MRLATLLAIAPALTLLAMACSSPLADSPTAPAPVPTVSSPTASPTIGQLGDQGKAVFASRCAKCHGANGQGVTAPAVIGPGEALAKYNTAQGLLSFIGASMPLDAPGSLTQQQYQQVLCYLLVQNNLTPASSTFNAGQLGNITLK